jgi:hypothetical protein
MKKISVTIALLAVVLFTGCGSSQPSVPKVKTSEKFKLERVSLNLTEKVKTEIKYHTQDELEQLLNDMILEELTKKELFSTDSTMNTLKIDVVYKRRYVGDETPFPSDSLGYPFIDYKINVINGTKLLTEINQEDMSYKGGFTMNMQVMAGTLRDKKYELEFIQAVANKIIDDITKL